MAEGISKIAKAMYDRGSGEEKEEAEIFYKKFVLEGDKDHDRLSNQISNEEVLKEVGSNFEDVLVVFYHNKHQISILRCYACHQLILGQSFSCLECVSFSRPNTRRRSLCCDCYGGGELIYHDHQPRSTSPPLLNEQQLLLKFATAKGVSVSGIRSVASAYYERSSDDERTMMKELFGEVDLNGDGKVSLAEVKRAAGFTDSRILDRVFQKLDFNGDGALDFVDFLVLFYSSKDQMGTVRCDGCQQLQLCSPYFSCTLCFSSYPASYDLCCDCYREGKVEHHHPFTNFKHTNLIATDFKRHHHANAQTKEEMLELQKIAMMQYEAAAPEVQDLAKDFFKSMDSDGDEKVDVKEFLSFMATEQPGMRCRQLFKQLDANEDGSLDFLEVMTLYYAIKSGRPNCGHCGDFIPGIFFSCVFCFRAKTSFTLCRLCYQSAAGCLHTHDGKSHFLDNYTLLETLREPPLSQPQADSSSTTTGRPSGKSKMNVALAAVHALDVAVAIFTATGSCTIS